MEPLPDLIDDRAIPSLSAIRYGASLFNEGLGEKIFKIRRTEVKNESIRELIEEAADKVIEFA